MPSRRLRSWLLVVAATLGGCGTAHRDGAGPAPATREPRTAAPAREPEVRWRLRLRKVRPNAVAVHKGTVYVADGLAVRALRLAGGDLVWHSSLKSEPTAGPRVTDDLILVPRESSNLECLERASGKPRWFFPAQLSVASTPAIQEDLVFLSATAPVASAETYVYAVRRDSGGLVWRELVPRGSADVSPVASGKMVLVPTLDGIIALDSRTGKPMWRGDFPSAYPSRPVLGTGTLYHATGGTSRSSLHAIRVATGEVLWSRTFETGGPVPCALAGKRLLVGVTGLGLLALDAATGERLWLAPGTGVVEVTPALDATTVYWFAGKRLHASRLTDGTELWSREHSGRGAHLLAAEGTLLAVTWGAELVALR